MANVDAISSNGLGMTAMDHLKIQCDPEDMRGPESLFLSLSIGRFTLIQLLVFIIVFID